MAARAMPVEMEVEQEDGNALIEVATSNPVQLFTSAEAFDALFARMQEELANTPTDTGSEAKRAKIRSAAHKVSRTKEAIKKARLGLTEQWRNQTNAVNAAGKVIEEKLVEYRNQIRAPLDAWEDAEDERVKACHATVARFTAAAQIALGDTAEAVRARLDEVRNTAIDPEVFQDLENDAVSRKEHAIAVLELGVEKLEREEADRAQVERDREELARLREIEARRAQEEADRLAAEKAKEEEFQRLRTEADGLIQHCRDCGNGIIGGQSQPFGLLLYELEHKVVVPERLASFRADIELARDNALERVREVKSKADEERRIANEKAEAERIEREKAAAAEAARREAEEAARREREEAERQAEEARAAERRRHEEELAAERARAEEADRQRQAEIDRVAREKQEREAAERREREEREARERDQAHRAKVQQDAIDAIVTAGGITAAKARAIVLAIGAGNIPAVRIQF